MARMANKADFVQQMYEAGLAAGLTDAAARVMAAQAAIESAYGERAPGNNYFAITKGVDWNGPTIAREDRDAKGNPVTQQFRSYDSPEAGLADRVSYMDAHFPGFSKAATTSDALNALRNGKYGLYYTAPQEKYEAAVKGINAKYLPTAKTAAQGKQPGPATAVEAAASLAKGGAPNIVDLTRGGKYGKYTIPADAYASTPRKGEIKGVVFHHTGGDSLAGAIGAGQKGGSQPGTGSTYYIDTDGTIVRYAPDDVKRTGIRDTGGKYRTDGGKPTSALSNDNTISVEVVAPDSKHFTEAQKEAAASLGKYLSATYQIDPSMIVGHGDIQGGAGGNKQPDEGVELAKFVRNDIGGLVPPMNIPTVASELDVTEPAPKPMPERPAALSENNQAWQTFIDSAASNGVLIHTGLKTVPAMTPGLSYYTPGQPSIEDSLSMMGIPSTDPIGEGPQSWFPSPIQLVDEHANENGGLVFSSTPQSPQAVAALNAIHDLKEGKTPATVPAAPVPMPGRPASIDGTAPTKEAAPTNGPKQTIKVGKHVYTVGDTFDQGGYHYTITPDGIDKARISSGKPNILDNIIKSVVKSKTAEAKPAVTAAVNGTGTKIADTAAGLGKGFVNVAKPLAGPLSAIGSSIGAMFTPANGVVTEHVGEQNGRPVVAVSGSPVFERAPAPVATTVDMPPTLRMFLTSQTSSASLVPKSLTDALSATSYASVAATVDKHLTQADPVLDSVHDKREAQQVQAAKPAPVSTSTVKTQSPGTVVKEQSHPAAPAAKEVAKPSSAPGSSYLKDVPKKVGDSFDAPAPLVPANRSDVAAPPQRQPTVTVSVPNPAYTEWQKQYGVGSVSPRAVTKLDDIHDRNDTATTVAQSSEPRNVAPPPPARTITQVKPVTPAAPAPVMVQQPTTKTAGAPTPSNDNSRVASPIYVDKATGARLAPQTISVYDNDTQRFVSRVVYRPVTTTAAPAPATSTTSSKSDSGSKPNATEQQTELNYRLAGNRSGSV